MNVFTRLKRKWKIESNVQLVLILLVFSLTGSLSVWIAKPLLAALSITKETLGPWGYYPLRILVIFPVYQTLLIVVATVFGQFRFFWAFERKFFDRLTGGRLGLSPTD